MRRGITDVADLSVPFLTLRLCPSPGYVGFDPLGFSTLADPKFLREAEIKHGRVAMLAAAGAIAQDFFTIPVSSINSRRSVPKSENETANNQKGSIFVKQLSKGSQFPNVGLNALILQMPLGVIACASAAANGSGDQQTGFSAENRFLTLAGTKVILANDRYQEV